MPLNTSRAPEAPALSDVDRLIAPTYPPEMTEVKTEEAISRWFYDFMKTSSGKSARTRLQHSKSSYARSHSLFLIYSTVFHAVTESIPGMQHGYNFTTEQLCGADVWLHWKGNAAAIAAGMCMAHLVSIKAIPLVSHRTPSGKGSCKYRRAPSDSQSALGADNSMNFIEILTNALPLDGDSNGAPFVHLPINQHYTGA